MAMTREAFGFEYTVDAFDCDKEALSNRSSVKWFFRALADALDMTIYRSDKLRMQVELYGNCKENFGITGLCPILTSSFTIHTVLSTRSLYLTVFSCKRFDPLDVDRVVRAFFNPSSKLRTGMRVR